MKECNTWTEHKATELGGVCGSLGSRQNGGDSLLTFLQMVPLLSSQMEMVKIMVMVMMVVVMMVVMVVMMVVMVIRRRRK